MESGSQEDVKDSIILRTSSNLEGIKKFYNYSLISSKHDAGSRSIKNQDMNPSEDIEMNCSNGMSTNEEMAAAGLYILNILVNDMGFNRQMVKNVLIYDKDIIGDDIQKAVEFCLKTNDGWKHTFVPDEKNKWMPDRQVFDELNNASIISEEERCLIWGEGRQEHKKLTTRVPSMISHDSNTFTSFHDKDNEEIKVSIPSVPAQEEESDESESDEEPIDEDEDMVNCLIWYDDHPISRTYALSWGHRFGITCLRLMFKVGINDGKVLENNCAHYECNKQYTETDVKSIVKSKRLLSKFEKFRTNIEVNKDKNKQWCPHPNCGLWVKGSKWKSKVKWDKGHQFWFICQQDWHKGNCKDHLNDKYLDYLSKNDVLRCPKCHSHTEKASGCNHMTWFWGYNWCWLCKSQYSDYHYKTWNVFGWASMQFTENWSKCTVILYYTLMIFILFPIFMIFCPLVYMCYGVTRPLDSYDNWFANLWFIPLKWIGSNYRMPWCNTWLLCIFYMPIILILGLITGVGFFALCYPFAIIVTIWKMIRLSFRDWRCFKTLT